MKGDRLPFYIHPDTYIEPWDGKGEITMAWTTSGDGYPFEPMPTYAIGDIVKCEYCKQGATFGKPCEHCGAPTL